MNKKKLYEDNANDEVTSELFEHLRLEAELGSEIEILETNSLAESTCLLPSRWIEISSGSNPTNEEEQSHIDACAACQKSQTKWEQTLAEHSHGPQELREPSVPSAPDNQLKGNTLPRRNMAYVTVASIASAVLGGAVVYWLMGDNESRQIAQIAAENQKLSETADRFQSVKTDLQTAYQNANSDLKEFLNSEPMFLTGEISVALIEKTLINQGQQRTPIESSEDKLNSLTKQTESVQAFALLLEKADAFTDRGKAEVLNLLGIAEANQIASADIAESDPRYLAAAQYFREAGEAGLAKAWLNLYLLSLRWKKESETAREAYLDRYLDAETDEEVRSFVRTEFK